MSDAKGLALTVVHYSKILSANADGSRPCEKPKTLGCDRISYSFKTALGAHIASQFNFDLEPKNIILVGL